uniref:Uncharacterized protein n=1 Tax=Arundo donax TaxID=35708 RepID=A0A0A9H4E2_ARUDO
MIIGLGTLMIFRDLLFLNFDDW